MSKIKRYAPVFAVIVSVFTLLGLASPLLLFSGCGNVVSGGACGGCPSNVAPPGSKIAVDSLKADTVAAGGSVCYPSVVFQVTDSAGSPLNGICVELTTNGLIALHRTTQCFSRAASDFKTYIRTQTDDYGTISVDFKIQATASDTYFVQAVSCSTKATTEAAITVN